jgi:hypothetical protein
MSPLRRADFGHGVRRAGPGLLLYSACQGGVNVNVRLPWFPHCSSARIGRRPSWNVSCALQASADDSFRAFESRSIPRKASPDKQKTVFFVACLATAMAAISRVTFSVLAIPIQNQYDLASTDLALLQSVLLFGYTMGQVRFLPWYL